MDAFKFNPNAVYKIGGKYKKQLEPISITTLMITVGHNKFFFAKFPNIWEDNYVLPSITNKDVFKDWNNTPMQFWQNQLNFATWCATAGCGVLFENHLRGTQDNPLLQNVYIFHVYYTIKKILYEIGVQLPTDQNFDPLSNIYDKRAYNRVCAEFNVDPQADWKQKIFPNNTGFGDVYTKGHTAWTQTDFRHNNQDKYIATQNVGNWDPTKMTFGPEIPGTRKCGVSSCQWPDPVKAHVLKIMQDPGVKNGWSTFVLDKSQGFTQAGVVRLNDTIRSYVYAVLGAQTRTRSRILDQGTSFEAQKEFLNIVNETINTDINISTSIELYQGILQHAQGRVDYVFGQNLYMAPSDMILRIDSNVAGYNNKIVIASSDLTIGINDHVNEREIVVPSNESFPTTPQDNDWVDITKNQSCSPPYKPVTPVIETNPDSHEDEKTSIIIGGIFIGLAIIWTLT